MVSKTIRFQCVFQIERSSGPVVFSPLTRKPLKTSIHGFPINHWQEVEDKSSATMLAVWRTFLSLPTATLFLYPNLHMLTFSAS
jgi:hypothetical protein